jgi:hypothetical protein
MSIAAYLEQLPTDKVRDDVPFEAVFFHHTFYLFLRFQTSLVLLLFFGIYAALYLYESGRDADSGAQE